MIPRSRRGQLRRHYGDLPGFDRCTYYGCDAGCLLELHPALFRIKATPRVPLGALDPPLPTRTVWILCDARRERAGEPERRKGARVGRHNPRANAGRADGLRHRLNNYLACNTSRRWTCRRAGARERPDDRPGQADLLAKLGEEHEQRYLQNLKDQGSDVVNIERGHGVDGSRAAPRRKPRWRAVALHHQATFFADGWPAGLRARSPRRPGRQVGLVPESTPNSPGTPSRIFCCSSRTQRASRASGAAPARHARR